MRQNIEALSNAGALLMTGGMENKVRLQEMAEPEAYVPGE
jgi:hypothetical protein